VCTYVSLASTPCGGILAGCPRHIQLTQRNAWLAARLFKNPVCNKAGDVRIKETLMRVRVTVIAVEKQ